MTTGRLLQLESLLVRPDRADALADVAAHADLGGGRGEQELLARDLRHELLQCRRVPVTDDAGHLEVVHGQDHPARRAGLGQLGHAATCLGQRGADAAELDRDQRAE